MTNDKSIANFSDRSLLKNLGHWLGLITLARNMPILLVDLDLKPLIIEAHQIGQQVSHLLYSESCSFELLFELLKQLCFLFRVLIVFLGNF